MRHLVDAKLRPKAAGACGETSAGTNAAMAAFSMNQNSALCLPLVTESQKLVWVHSNQISSQLSGAGELLKAFDRSPYLTKKETAALAQRCSLPADKVKVWFMVQRLRYGISWDCEDIREVQTKFKSSQRKAQGEQDLQNKVGESARGGIRKKKKKKRKDKECDGKEEGKVRGAQSANMRGMMGNNLSVRNMEQDRLKNKERGRKDEEDKRNACEKQKRMEITHPTVGERRMMQGDDGTMERGGEMRSLDQVEREGPKSIQSETTNKFIHVNVYPAEQCELVTQLQPSDDQTGVLETAEVAPLATNFNTGMITGFEETPAMETTIEGDGHAEFITDVDKLFDISPAVNTLSTLSPQQADQIDPSTTIHNPSRFKTKSYSQLRMMKAAFRHCQYPNSDDFDYLTPAIGLPRGTLVKWFSDTRYSIKKRKPSWVTEKQYRKMLSTITYWQHVEIREGRSSAQRKRCLARKCEGTITV